MSFVRPEVAAAARRWREPAAAAMVTGAGIWIAVQGGWVLLALGAAIAAVGAGWALLALRRLRFLTGIEAPGIVEIDEGLIRYLHPRVSGEVSLAEVIELRLLTLRGRRVWRLADAFGRGLLVPVDAAGAEALFDAFASLPGLSSADLAAALAPGGAGRAEPLPAPAQTDRLVWRRAGSGLAPFATAR
jgi:hypothetical protein